MFTIPDELVEALERVAARKNQSVVELLQDFVEHEAQLDVTETALPGTREWAEAKLAAIGMLSEAKPGHYGEYTTEQLMELGKVPPGTRLSEELIREERDAE